MTWKEEITAEEKLAIDEFKRRVVKDLTPQLLEDETLYYRFMKARDYDLEQAEKMLRKHISWRKEFQIDTILRDFKTPEVLKRFAANSVIGYDKEGCIVRYIDIGNSDTKGILNSVRKSVFVKFNLYLMESDMVLMKEQNEKLGKCITKIIYIYNYDNFTFSKATHKKTLDMMMYGINLYQDNYPERVKSIFVINASIYYTMLFSVIKYVVSAPILEKIKCFGSEGWKKQLLQLIDADVLPVFLGGNRTDENGDPLCSSFIIHGQPLPEGYLMKKFERHYSLSTADGSKRINTAPFGKTEIKLEVEEKNSILEWEFETKSKDIGFGVYFRSKDKGAKIEELVSNQRIDTCLEPETGMYRCEKLGTYIIVFDNSYSWIRPKEIYYRARVLKASEQNIPA